MTIDKAIRRLQAFVRWRKPDPDDNFVEAVQLGIEALKAYKKSQEARWYPPGYKLPGETEGKKEVEL